ASSRPTVQAARFQSFARCMTRSPCESPPRQCRERPLRRQGRPEQPLPFGNGSEQQLQGPRLGVAALDTGVVPADDQVERRQDDQRSLSTVPERSIDVAGDVGPVAFAIAVAAVGPPEEAVTTEGISLIVATADRALTRQ